MEESRSAENNALPAESSFPKSLKTFIEIWLNTLDGRFFLDRSGFEIKALCFESLRVGVYLSKKHFDVIEDVARRLRLQ